MTHHGLRRSRPSEQGVDARGILAFLDAVERRGIELHSLMVVRHGHVVAEGWWHPYSADLRHLVYSVSKTVTATASALAIAEGRFLLEDRVVSFFPEEVPDDVDPRVTELTVHHLLSMSTGHVADTLPAMLERPAGEWVRTFLSIPPQAPVGSRHVYNNGCTFVLGAIVQRVTGQGLLDYLRPRLLEPLGITGATWQTDDLGRELGWSGLHITTEAIAALGEMFLRDGIWQGRRILPEGWVARAGRPQVGTAADSDPDWRLGYGYQMWASRHGFRADGAFGQFSLVLPDQDAVIATTAGQAPGQVILDPVWEYLLPALAPAPAHLAEDAAVRAAEHELMERLGSLALRAVSSAADDGAGHTPGARLPPGAWSVVGPLAPTTPPGEDTPWFPALADVELTPGADGWALSVREDGSRLTVPCGDGRWVTSGLAHPSGREVPVAASAGRSGSGARVEIIFLETPHRLQLDIEASGARMAWNVPPLRAASLADLAA